MGFRQTSAGDGMVEPLRTTVNWLGYLAYGVGAVRGAIKGLFIGTTGAYIVSSVADGRKWGTGGEACVSLADGFSKTSFDELTRGESEGWLK